MLLRTCSSKLEQELEQHRKEDLELRLSGGSPESQVALKVLPPCDFLCNSHFVSFFFRTRLVLQFEPQESSESISREEKLLEEMLRLKLTEAGTSPVFYPIVTVNQDLTLEWHDAGLNFLGISGDDLLASAMSVATS